METFETKKKKYKKKRTNQTNSMKLQQSAYNFDS